MKLFSKDKTGNRMRRLYTLLFILNITTLFSQTFDPFSTRYQTLQKGNIRILSNTSVSCAGSCTATGEMPPSGANNNNNFNMTYVDVDGITSTFMSSSDSLALPNCSEVLWAGLYWGARVGTTTANVPTVPNYANRNTIKLRLNNGAYTTLVADELFNQNTVNGHKTYHCFKNITTIAAAAGPNVRYTLADLVTQTGNGSYGGWSIVIVYKNVFQSQKQLSVFDGLVSVSSGSGGGNVSIPISGFVTPQLGPVSIELGLITHDGDRGVGGDQLSFNGVPVSDALHPVNNICNSSISYNGALTPFRVPNFNNTLGHDASIIVPNNTALNYIGNNATSATLNLASSSDQLFSTTLTLAIDVFEPDLRATVFLNDLNGGMVSPGDTLEFTIVGKNIGSDVANGVFIADTLDPRTTYLPGSLQIVSGPNAGLKTDVLGDDQAEYIAAGNVVKFRVGTGANATTGGQMLSGNQGADSTVVKFKVTVVNDCLMFQCDQTLDHKAYIFGSGSISGNFFNNGGDADLYGPNGCPTTASSTLSISVAGCPTPAITSGMISCVGDTLTLSVPSSPNALFSWSGPNGFTAPDTNSIIIPNPTTSNSGLYSIQITFPGLDCSLDTFKTITVFSNPVLTLDSLVHVSCNNFSDGAIYTTVSHGNIPYISIWSNITTGEVITQLEAGNYSVEVVDSNYCTTEATFTILEPTELTGVGSPINSYNGFPIDCFNNTTGSATIVASGGTPGYTYLWSNGSVNDTVTNLATGIVAATITDANGCTKSVNININQPNQLLLSQSKTNVSCFGGSDGAVNLSVNGGVAPYTYLWSNGATTQDISGLVAGTYSVGVTDANNCTATLSVTVDEPLEALSTSTAQTNIVCHGLSTGAIDVTVSGGTAPYTYSWSTGSANQDLNTIPAGTYSVLVTDVKLCTTATTVTITEPDTLAVSAALVAVKCFGDSTGAITISVSGGEPNYSFLWSTGATSQNIDSLPTGIYSVSVTDSNNCVFNLSSIVITQPLAALNSTYVIDAVNCFEGNDGAIDVTVTGGTTPYTYLWSTGATTQDIAQLTSATYSLQITDANNCTTSISDSVQQPIIGIQVSEIHQDVLCYGLSTATIDVTVIGGTMPYTYNWSNGQSTQDLQGISAGDYSLNLTDSLGCQGEIVVFISQPDAPIILSETHTDALCVGGLQGTIDLSVNGGTLPYTYFWNNNTTTQDQEFLYAGNYQVFVTDGNNCVDSISVTILDPNNSMVLSETHVDIICFGGSTGSIDLTVTDGTPAYSYQWNNGATTQDLVNLTFGTYSVNVTDANSCGEFISVTLQQPATPITVNSISTDILCNGFTTGSFDVTTQGGVAPYQFSWSNGASSEDISTVGAGNYVLTIVDNLGCEFVLLDTLYQPSPLGTSSNNVNIFCFGDSTGTIDFSVSGGVTPYTYAWSNAATTQDISNLPVGIYSVIVTDQNNCVINDTIQLTQPAAPLTLSAIETDILCFSDSTGSIDITISGGTAPYTYLWSNGETTSDVDNLVAGVYSLLVTDALNCILVDTFELIQPNLPLTNALSMTPVICHGDSTGIVSVVANGGTLPYSYSWSNNVTTALNSGVSIGNYSVLITDNHGCISEADTVVTQPPALVISGQQVNILCHGDSTGSIDITIGGGFGTYSYNWTNSATTQDLINLPAGTYSLTVTDENACTIQQTNTLTQPASPLQMTDVITNVLCFGNATGVVNTTVTGGTFPYQYAWSNNLTSADLTGMTAGTYSVVVTDTNNCTIADTFQITEPLSPLSTLASMVPVLCHGDSSGAVSVSVSGGTPGYNFLWSNGVTTPFNPNLPLGAYSVEVTDSNGCISLANIAVSQPTPLVIDADSINVLCFGDATGSAFVTAIGGVGSYTYFWNTGLTTDSISGILAGTYTVTVTDSNNCSTSTSTTVLQPLAPIAATFQLLNNICFEGSIGEIDMTVTGGTGSYQYVWDNSSLTEDLSGLTSGLYTVEITDSNNCVLIETVAVIEPDQLAILSELVTNVSCNDFSDGSIDITVIGGTQPYTYNWSTGATTEDISNLEDGTYSVTVVDSSLCERTFSWTITEPDTLDVTYTFVEPDCFGYSDGSITATATGGTQPYTYSWSNGQLGNVNSMVTAGNYTVTVEDANSCIYELQTTLTQPAQIQVTFDADILEGCDPLNVNFTNTSLEQFSSSWDFGDGNFGLGSSINHTFYGPDCYDITLLVTDANGCFNSAQYQDFVCVLPVPTAGISVSDPKIFASEPETYIGNTSIGAATYIWNLGDDATLSTYFEPGNYSYPVYTLDEFIITLIAIGENGCTDTTFARIEMDNGFLIFVPNTFTPNGDERNNTFQPIIPVPVSSFNMKIYNRWGEIVFESYDPSASWDGYYNGHLVQDGTYIWEIVAVTDKANTYIRKGHLNVLK